MEIQWLKEIAISHRGLHENDHLMPENSLIAFQNSIGRGYPIELDIHTTKAGEVVVFHDENLQRMCGVDKKTINLTRQERLTLKLKGGEQNIPLLAEVLDLVDGKVPILIEIKDSTVKQSNRLILEILNKYSGSFAIQSFNPLILAWFSRHAVHIPRGQLASNFENHNMLFVTKFILKNLLMNWISKPNFIGYDINHLPNYRVNKLKSKGHIILGWTVRSKQQESLALQYCDNIIFENYMP